MPFDEKYLDDLRASVRVSEVVSRKFKLKRIGKEFQAIDDTSFKVSDAKQRWFDNGSNKRDGDVFGFLQEFHGLTFPQAVEEIAKIAGLGPTRSNGGHREAAGDDRRSNGDDRWADEAAGSVTEPHRSNGRDRETAPADASFPDREDAVTEKARAPKRVIATYDYTNAQGEVTYQVVRFEPKGFAQRRPDPSSRDGWAWGLKGVEHTLYKLPDIIQDMSEERGDQRTWFIAEGEKDAETLIAWGVAATTNSGGAKHFTAAMAKHFTDAGDVVVLEDADDAGKWRTSDLVPKLLEVGAHARALRIADHHPGKPQDITDWRDACGGTAEQLFAIVDKLPEWEPPKPEPFKSVFGAKTYVDLAGRATPYLWRIKGLVPMSENMLVMGPSRSGKTFEVLDMAMHVVLGQRYAGRRVVPAGIAYCSYEGQAGFENRLRAYIKAKGLTAEQLRHFAWWTRPPGLYADEDRVEALGAEIKAVTENWAVPLGAIVIDTHNSATRGSSEIKSEDISKVLDRYDKLSAITGAPLWIVGHTNNEGHHRGNQQFFNRIETTLYVEKLVDGKGASATDRKDDLGRALRRVTVEKQREGEDRIGWDFVLDKVVISVDADGDEVTSMISADPQRAGAGRDEHAADAKKSTPSGAWHLSRTEVTFFHALLRARSRTGIKPPPELTIDNERVVLPRSIALVVAWTDITAVYKTLVPIDDESKEGKQKRLNRIKSAMHKARNELQLRGVIGIAYVGVENAERSPAYYVWPTGRPVVGPGLRWPEQSAMASVEPDPPMIDPVTGRDVLEDFVP